MTHAFWLVILSLTTNTFFAHADERTNAQALRWSDSMFESLSHDFGAVPKGYCKKSFNFTNTSEHPVHIKEYRARFVLFDSAAAMRYVDFVPEKELIQPGETIKIGIGIRTQNSTNKSVVGVFITFDQPKLGTSMLQLSMLIRSDIVCIPSKISLGSVKQSNAEEKTMKIEYAGQPDW